MEHAATHMMGVVFERRDSHCAQTSNIKHRTSNKSAGTSGTSATISGHRHNDTDSYTLPVRAIFQGTLAVGHERLVVDEIIVDTPEGL